MKNTSRTKSPADSDPAVDAITPADTSEAIARDGDELSPAQRKLLAEALRLGEEARNVIEDKLVSYGRWMLVNIFDDDAAAALDLRADNPVWLRLVARAGGPTLRLSRKMVYIALEIAARDKRITDEAWRALEPTRKELLLPLGDEAMMRKAAQHVQAMKLSFRATKTYAASLRAEQGSRQTPRLTGARFGARMKRLSEEVATGAYLRQATRAAGGLSDMERAEALRSVTALQKWATEMARVLRRKG